MTTENIKTFEALCSAKFTYHKILKAGYEVDCLQEFASLFSLVSGLDLARVAKSEKSQAILNEVRQSFLYNSKEFSAFYKKILDELQKSPPDLPALYETISFKRVEISKKYLEYTSKMGTGSFREIVGNLLFRASKTACEKFLINPEQKILEELEILLFPLLDDATRDFWRNVNVLLDPVSKDVIFDTSPAGPLGILDATWKQLRRKHEKLKKQIEKGMREGAINIGSHHKNLWKEFKEIHCPIQPPVGEPVYGKYMKLHGEVVKADAAMAKAKKIYRDHCRHTLNNKTERDAGLKSFTPEEVSSTVQQGPYVQGKKKKNKKKKRENHCSTLSMESSSFIQNGGSDAARAVTNPPPSSEVASLSTKPDHDNSLTSVDEEEPEIREQGGFVTSLPARFKPPFPPSHLGSEGGTEEKIDSKQRGKDVASAPSITSRTYVSRSNLLLFSTKGKARDKAMSCNQQLANRLIASWQEKLFKLFNPLCSNHLAWSYSEQEKFIKRCSAFISAEIKKPGRTKGSHRTIKLNGEIGFTFRPHPDQTRKLPKIMVDQFQALLERAELTPEKLWPYEWAEYRKSDSFIRKIDQVG